MDSLLRGVGLVLFGISCTWLLTVVVGRAITRRGLALWVWDRSGTIGRVLIGAGFGLAILGLAQAGGPSTASSLLVFGALMGMAGIWLVLPGP
jgi:hypothetical protein